MAVIALTGERREDTGKGPARRARQAGRIPGVLYGHGETPVALAVGARDFELALRTHEGGNPIVNLKLGAGEFTALVREMQRDPITHEVMHLDFQHISLTETIEVSVGVRLVGIPAGVKDAGGILEAILREVKVRCLPTKIPSHLDVDVSALGIGDSVHVRDLQVPDVEILTDLETTVATVVPPTVIEEKAPEAVVTETPTEPELITKGKKEEEEPEAGAEKKAPEKKAPEKK